MLGCNAELDLTGTNWILISAGVSLFFVAADNRYTCIYPVFTALGAIDLTSLDCMRVTVHGECNRVIALLQS